MPTTSVIVLFVILFLLTAIIVYYISGRKKRRLPYYISSDRSWKERFPGKIQKISYSVFLIGDAGAPALDRQEPTFTILENQLRNATEKSALFFLGDNVYPKGLPKKEDPARLVGEKRLVEQLKLADSFKGRVIFISGNHDWNKGRKGGYDAVMRQQEFVDEYKADNISYLPRDGCPGPVEIQLSEDLTAIVINTQWWVHEGKKPIGQKHGCSIDNELEFFIVLNELLEKNKEKNILVIGHHPMYSKAYHGGRFDIKQHLFPLTELNKKMYVPLPLIGSVYPMYRRYIGSREDMSHPRYSRLRKKLLEIFRKYDDLIYAAGHDHNLQYIKKGNQHYVVSGAGCKTTFVQQGKGALFTHSHKGFFRLDYYLSGEIWLEAWEPSDSGEAILAYRKQIKENEITADMKPGI